MPERLHEDHANARILAEAVAALPQVALDLAHVQTNIVIFKLRNADTGGAGDAAALVAKLKHRGVLSGTTGPDTVRFVTHHDVDRTACLEAARIAVEVIRES